MAGLRRRVFSGIQPTGVPHVGNYLGAIKNWINIQNNNNNIQNNNDNINAAGGEHNAIFCIVDLHSTTVTAGNNDANTRRENIFGMLATLLACGIDPKKSLIFQQSRVPYHTELAWLLSCLTTTGQLTRMHQWKTKQSKEREASNVGLFSYPVLMAADILLYKSTHVPVGEDQEQHINLARDLTVTFNKRYSPTFTVPEGLYTDTARVKSLRKPDNKMSKSDDNANSRIDLTDSADVIVNKLRKAVTDSEPYITTGELANRPGVANLVSMYSAFSGLTVQQVVDQYKDVEYFTAPLKNDLAQVVVEHLKPIRERYTELIGSREYLERILIDGSEDARKIAQETMDEVYVKVGMR